ncbi:MAG: metallophosphoesterase [Acidaminococcus fermentans]|uniref:metallophosphoesterase family protein n=1 Tax=Acidaminococcus fermentans TaxID=905 RepID=UPI00242B9935|nr:metallophosphoesterase [Acidaminococcus fermentans]MDD7195647.1 metallophosphoesterase [Acidaminococcus fermentans]
MQNKKKLFLTALCTLAACVLPLLPLDKPVQARRYERIVVCSDIHYGSKTREPELRARKIANKKAAVRDINGWEDVDLCVFTGDMVQKTGSPADYKLARELTDRVKKPKEFLAGNHEVIYHRDLSSTGRLVPADPYERGLHLQTYEKTFGPLYHSRKLGQYFLVFLSPDTLESKYAVELSKEQLAWLEKELKDHRQEPHPDLLPCPHYRHPDPRQQTGYAPELRPAGQKAPPTADGKSPGAAVGIRPHPYISQEPQFQQPGEQNPRHGNSGCAQPHLGRKAGMDQFPVSVPGKNRNPHLQPQKTPVAAPDGPYDTGSRRNEEGGVKNSHPQSRAASHGSRAWTLQPFILFL